MTTLSTHDNRVRTFESGGARWWVCGAGQSLVTGPGAPNWFSLVDDPHAELVKHGRHRAVWQRKAGGVSVFAKSHDPIGWLARLKDLVGLNPGVREFRALVEAQDRRVPAVRPLAVGRARGGRSVLLTEAFDGAMPLAELSAQQAIGHDDDPHDGRLRRLLRALAEVLADSHRGGLAHRDMHPNNLLVTAGERGDFEVRLVDLQGVRRFRGTVPCAPAVEELAQLEHYFQRESPARVRLRLLFDYLVRREGARFARGAARRAMFHRWQAAVLRAVPRHAARLSRQRDRRLRTDNQYFFTHRFAGGWCFRVVGKLARQRVLPVVGFVERTRLEWAEAVQPILLGSAGGEPRTSARPNGAGDLRIERWVPRTLFERISWSLFGSPALRAFHSAHRSRHRDQAGDLLLGFGEQRRCGLIVSAVLVRLEHRTTPDAADHRGDAEEGG